jgi:pre-mRNA-processing factor SLU7
LCVCADAAGDSIREDTAKYLRNLDESSAFYDPKTRSMRENPNPDANARARLCVAPASGRC